METQKTTATPNSSKGPQLLCDVLPAPRSFAAMAQSTPDEIAQRDAEEKALRIGPAKRRLTEQMGLRYAQCSIENYSVQFVEQKTALESVKEFISRIHERIRAGSGLIFYGSVGTGKDHLLSACLFAAIEGGYMASWKNAQSVYAAARDGMDGKKPERELLKEFTHPQILGLSDPIPPKGELNAYRTELLWRIVDERYRSLRPTWLTLNAKTVAECQGSLSVPVWDRLQDGALCVPCSWPSKREAVPSTAGRRRSAISVGEARNRIGVQTIHGS